MHEHRTGTERVLQDVRRYDSGTPLLYPEEEDTKTGMGEEDDLPESSNILILVTGVFEIVRGSADNRRPVEFKGIPTKCLKPLKCIDLKVFKCTLEYIY